MKYKYITKEQIRHLMDYEKCQRIEELFGKIEGKYVLYKGESKELDKEIKYFNVSEYLKGISNL